MSGFGGAITFLHLPMLLAATLESPLAAAVVGVSFGVMTGLHFPLPPLIYHVGARALAGLTAGITFQAISQAANDGAKVTVASAATAVVGTAANTIFMCLIVFLLKLGELNNLLAIAFVHGGVETAAALIFVIPLTIALKDPQS